MIWLFLKALNLFFIFIFIFSMLVFIITCTRERKASALSLAVSSLFSLLCVLVYVFILRIRLSAAGFSACVIFGCAIGAALGLTASVYRDETGHIMMRNSAWHLLFWAGLFLFTQLTVFFFHENAGTPLFLL
ncbi:MAG: hypothetical protein JW928_07205, partial [Candidatus Aureabacteria bacterium]|nr:hypothetical protein [Candidatus Auribacterota bacterium]